MLMDLARARLPDSNERQLKRLARITGGIHAAGVGLSSCSDRRLQEMTGWFRERLAGGETMDHLLPEAFAVVREASGRVLSVRHYDEQLMGGIALHEGSIVEMQTGEGKTIAGALPVYLNALAGKGVHVITANEYLARRDCCQLGQLFGFLGLSTGAVLSSMSLEEKQSAYACDITYGTGSEFGFDYLRDNLALHPRRVVQRPFFYGLVDEVDSILIDEARTPLIISGRPVKPKDLYGRVNRFVSGLEAETDYTVCSRLRTVALTEAGVASAEAVFGVKNLFALEEGLLYHHILQSLRAHHLIRRDVEYCIKDSQIVLVDEFTGRLMFGRQYGDGLHQALEAKEGLAVKNESVTQASITLQHYFRMYPKVAGMSGTVRTEEEEFKNLYGLDTVSIPTHRPVLRRDYPDLVYKTEKAKYRAIVKDICNRYSQGQPVLAGTVTIERSEMLSSLLTEKGIPHQVLNAKNPDREAEMIAGAGQYKAVTIATNMAGRGTDIKLGDGVAELGGLYVIGTERHESRRIDNQLRGRAGRQGDPGESRFYLSLEDSLLLRFGSEGMIAKLERFGFDEDVPLEGRHVSKAVESAQRVVEGGNASSLLHLTQYDLVLSRQRDLIYRDRRELLTSVNREDMLPLMIASIAGRTVEAWCKKETVPEEWPLAALAADIGRYLPIGGAVDPGDLRGMEKEALVLWLQDKLMALYLEKRRILGPSMLQRLEQALALQIADSRWISHMEAMAHLREGIHLRAYSGENPLREYQVEGHQLFLELVAGIEEELVSRILRANIDSSVTEASAG